MVSHHDRYTKCRDRGGQARLHHANNVGSTHFSGSIRYGPNRRGSSDLLVLRPGAAKPRWQVIIIFIP